MSNQPITVRIPPEIYARANRYAFDVDGSPKSWFDVRDAIAKALYEQNLEMEELRLEIESLKNDGN